jgi:IS605 OrfB family transposase
VDFDAGTIELLVIAEGENGAWLLRWLPARMRCDPRLRPSNREKVFREEGRCPPYVSGRAASRLNNLKRAANPGQERRAGYAGAKLVIHKDRKELLFTVIEQDAPRLMTWKKTKLRSCPADNAFSPDGLRIPLKVMAVDLGIRHPGAYAIAQGERTDNRWNVQHISKGIVQGTSIPGLRQLRQHDRSLRKGRRKRGKGVKGEEDFIELQTHRSDMAEDRFKKVAHTIVDLARQHQVHLVLFERLSDLSPTAFDERWVNRQLRDMNRRRIVEMTKEQCREFGIECKDDVNPWLTSHLCSRCFRPGWRFSMKRKDAFHEDIPRTLCREFGFPTWDTGGHLFRCPHCGYSANADVNAAANLSAKFFGLWVLPELARKDWIYTWTEDGRKRELRARESFEEWAAEVKKRKTLGETPF